MLRCMPDDKYGEAHFLRLCLLGCPNKLASDGTGRSDSVRVPLFASFLDPRILLRHMLGLLPQPGSMTLEQGQAVVSLCRPLRR